MYNWSKYQNGLYSNREDLSILLALVNLNFVTGATLQINKQKQNHVYIFISIRDGSFELGITEPRSYPNLPN